MDRTIFELNASVEATSLYILLCALFDQGESVTLERARVNWSGPEESLFDAAEELIRRGVVKAAEPLSETRALALNPRDDWR